MLYMLDTDICSYLIKGSSETLLLNLNNHYNDTICISSVTYAELLFGAARVNSKKTKNKIDAITQKIDITPFDEQAAGFYAKIRSTIEKNGTPIGNMDILIASCALSARATLITNNEKHFKYVPNLHIENWTKTAEHSITSEL